MEQWPFFFLDQVSLQFKLLNWWETKSARIDREFHRYSILGYSDQSSQKKYHFEEKSTANFVVCLLRFDGYICLFPENLASQNSMHDTRGETENCVLKRIPNGKKNKTKQKKTARNWEMQLKWRIIVSSFVTLQIVILAEFLMNNFSNLILPPVLKLLLS